MTADRGSLSCDPDHSRTTGSSIPDRELLPLRLPGCGRRADRHSPEKPVSWHLHARRAYTSGLLAALGPGQPRRQLVAAALFCLLAAAATMVLLQAVLIWNGHSPWGFEAGQAWSVDRDLMRGIRYENSPLSPTYPLPSELLFLPLALLSHDAAQVISIVFTVALIAGALVLWNRTSHAPWASLLPLFVSVPVLGAVQIDHPYSALGLAALGLAAWAYRRQSWFLLGVAAALALIRPQNALAALPVLLIGLSGRATIRAGMGAAAVLVPLVAVPFLWDPGWFGAYQQYVSLYPFSGIYGLLVRYLGVVGVSAVLLALGVGGLWLRRLGRDPLDAFTLVLAATVLVVPAPGLYCGLFVLPALQRVGARPEYRALPWIASASAWAIPLAVSPWLLANPPGIFPLLSALAYWLAIQTYPLLRRGQKRQHSGP